VLYCQLSLPPIIGKDKVLAEKMKRRRENESGRCNDMGLHGI